MSGKINGNAKRPTNIKLKPATTAAIIRGSNITGNKSRQVIFSMARTNLNATAMIKKHANKLLKNKSINII